MVGETRLQKKVCVGEEGGHHCMQISLVIVHICTGTSFEHNYSHDSTWPTIHDELDFLLVLATRRALLLRAYDLVVELRELLLDSLEWDGQ